MRFESNNAVKSLGGVVFCSEVTIVSFPSPRADTVMLVFIHVVFFSPNNLSVYICRQNVLELS